MNLRFSSRARLLFPYWRLVRTPADLFAYGYLRFAYSRLARTKGGKALLSRKPLIALRPPILRQFKLLLSADDPSQGVIFQEIFLERVYKLESIPFVPQRIVDCGAHIGMFVLLAAAHFPGVPITAFEPNPRNAGILRMNCRVNGIDAVVVEAAVSDRQGEVSFSATSSYDGKIISPSLIVGDRETVRSVNLIEFVQELRAKRLILKMDIEGHEEILLPQLLAVLPEQCGILFESHGGEREFRRLRVLLEGQRFEVVKHRERGPLVDATALRILPELPAATRNAEA